MLQTFKLGLLCALLGFAAGLRSYASVPTSLREPALVTTSFEEFTTLDKWDRPIHYYLSNQDQITLPLVLFVQGSGCASHFKRTEAGRVQGGYGNLLLPIFKGRAHVLLVEKPGVQLFDAPDDPGTAIHCSQEFKQEHSLDGWVDALAAAVESARQFGKIQSQGTLAIGHSEGGITVATLANRIKSVSHLALLSSNGPTQLYDLTELARAQNLDSSPEVREEAVNNVYKQWNLIQKDPQSTTKMAWGHPYLRWSSFISISTIDQLENYMGRIFLVHGSSDRQVPVGAFDLTRARLQSLGREVKVARREGADHSLNYPGQPKPQGMIEVFEEVRDWYSPPISLKRPGLSTRHYPDE